jgi:glutathione synthase/RimK-type ligase-like ATP-grasp enzyme
MKKTTRIVVITDKRDAHLPYVQKHLSQPLLIIDPSAIVKGTELSYAVHEGKISVVYNGELLNPTSVWYRRPLPIPFTELPVDPLYKEYAYSALSRHVDQLLTAFEDAWWVSDYYAMQRANSKSLQLAIAGRLGFQTPDTLTTSDAAAAKRFIDSHDAVIVKTLSTATPIIAGKPRVFYTTVLAKKVLPDLRNLHLAPSIFQTAIDIAFDIRVNVIGNRVFAAAIHNNNHDFDPAVRDWRFYQRTEKLHIEQFTLPIDTATQCIELMRAFGLRCGAIDLVMDKKGNLWFLENNSVGQWAFIEDACDQPLGEAFAELLQRKD